MACLVHLEALVSPKVNIEQEEAQLRDELVVWLQCDLVKLTQILKLALCTNGHYTVKELPIELKSRVISVNFNLDGQTDELSHLLTIDSDQLGSCLTIECYFYKLHDEIMQNSFEEDLPATFHTLLPSKNLDGLWESLIFDSNIRLKLLNYVKTSLLFANQNVNPSIITWNKVILLHGPPGTGKTSLCKALAQKFAIRTYESYQNFQLIEINSHSIFSKWFSESGKLVLKLFDGIREFAEDGSNLIFLLIDEVESLAYDRQKNSSSDPSDAIRVVNALLTQIDSIRKYANVIILTTSNVIDAMDNAFVDRADIKQYIGMPTECTTYKIFHHCIQELVNSKIISGAEREVVLSYDQLKLESGTNSTLCEELTNSKKLLQIVQKSNSLSGRTLRKLPFLAIALYGTSIPIDIKQYLICLEKAVDKQMEDNKYFYV